MAIRLCNKDEWELLDLLQYIKATSDQMGVVSKMDLELCDDHINAVFKIDDRGDKTTISFRIDRDGNRVVKEYIDDSR